MADAAAGYLREPRGGMRFPLRTRPLGVAAALLFLLPAAAGAQDLPGKLRLVAHDPLGSRGQNADLALGGHYAYVGSFGDSSIPDAGVDIVDISKPGKPKRAGFVPAKAGLVPFWLRYWADQKILVVNYNVCLPPTCPASGRPNGELRFYDVAKKHADRPKLLMSVRSSALAHDFYLWQDPDDPDRALIYISNSTTAEPSVVAYDISGVRRGKVRRLDGWAPPTSWNGLYGFHSVAISADGNRAYAASYDLGYFVLSTRQLANGKRNGQISLLTPFENRITYPGVNAHSFIELPGGGYAMAVDEIYGCPWGWPHVVDVSDAESPAVIGEARLSPYNDPALCAGATLPPSGEYDQSFSAHQPTLSCHLAMVSWYGGGLQLFTRLHAQIPERVAQFIPKALPSVLSENPYLTGVEMFSFPVVRHGLIYVLDMRNGLYVLRYSGPHAREIERTRFLEGNSNQSGGGHAYPPGAARCG